MAKELLARLRGARRMEVFVALALAAMLALALTSGGWLEQRSGQTDLEARIERVLSEIRGAGRVRAVVSQDESGATVGAVVVADGADDMAVYLKMQYAVQTLLNVESDRIEIIDRGEGREGGL